jgi:hypothetical protein
MFRRKFFFPFFFLLCLYQTGMATRLSGKITDEKNNPLPFATVYAENTTKGTTANADGEYFLDLADGNYRIVYRYVGFSTHFENIQLAGKPITIDVVLKEESLRLNEVVVKAEGKYEDPAYEIIRNAVKKRKSYLDQQNSFACDVYIKGLVRLLKAPKKILGQDVSIPGADSSGKGIVYLSESVSKYYFQKPREKEVMISSKVSGNNRGFSFNSASDLRNYNFYENLLQTGLNERGFVSPIAQSALLFYDYKLLGTYKEGEQTVHKIEVIPKRRTDPVFKGIIYIQDESWRLHSIDLMLTKDANIELLDTLKISQVFIPAGKGVWMPGTQEFTFGFGVFGFRSNGYFIGSMSNYEIKPTFEKGFFTNEVIKVETEANKKDTAYWQTVRPVPLTLEESKDYVRKDSLATVWESKPYLDSLDAKNNKFKLGKALTGYTYSNRYRNYYLSIPSVLSNVQFNTVEGLVLNGEINFFKRYKETRRLFSVENNFRYGFSGKQLYAQTALRYLYNPVKSTSVRLSGGRYISQFNEDAPISPLVNTIYTLLNEENFMKLYEKRFGALAYRRELINGLLANTSLEFARRLPLYNTTDYTFRDRKEVEFLPNTPVVAGDTTPFVAYNPYNALTFSLELQINFRQKYYSRPNLKLNLDSPFPTLTLQYRKGIKGVASSMTDFDFIRIGLNDEISAGLVGQSRFDVSFGSFLSRKSVPFADYRHFMGNQTLIATNQPDAFYLLDYYRFSTTETYWEGHYEHHFNGFLFNKIPLLKWLRWQEVVGAHYLHTPVSGHYLEVNAGIDRILKIGKVIRAGRVDFIVAFNEGKRVERGIVFRIGF